MKKQFLLLAFAATLYACGGSSTTTTQSSSESAEAPKTESAETAAPASTESYDPHRGEGKFTAENVNVGATLDANMATEGDKIQGVKCSSCHKLSDERLVGPGWKGVTERRKPEWIMNFITNPDPMIDKDPEVQAQLEICLVRMPNQSLSDNEARSILEFMRKNDGVK
ncbi:MAG: c-type cytochrome [Bacteroidia bacterium]|nr:c-type cytochrome [Bacteroidia bacterium]MCC7533534.1 c-type cytochrome [Bacteroidia bacterium]MCZ2141431.1 cytochrome c [Bacteroidia bacterium]